MKQLTINVVDDIQEALQRLGELELKEESIAIKIKNKINDIKEKANNKLTPLQDEMVELKIKLEEYATENKEKIFTKGKQFNTKSGHIRFKLTEKLEVLDEVKTIKYLTKHNMNEAIGERDPYVLKIELKKDKYKPFYKKLGVSLNEENVFIIKTER